MDIGHRTYRSSPSLGLQVGHVQVGKHVEVQPRGPAQAQAAPGSAPQPCEVGDGQGPELRIQDLSRGGPGLDTGNVGHYGRHLGRHLGVRRLRIANGLARSRIRIVHYEATTAATSQACRRWSTKVDFLHNLLESHRRPLLWSTRGEFTLGRLGKNPSKILINPPALKFCYKVRYPMGRPKVNFVCSSCGATFSYGIDYLLKLEKEGKPKPTKCKASCGRPRGPSVKDGTYKAPSGPDNPLWTGRHEDPKRGVRIFLDGKWVNEGRHKAGELRGSPLTIKEHVRYLDGNPCNTSPDNLLVISRSQTAKEMDHPWKDPSKNPAKGKIAHFSPCLHCDNPVLMGIGAKYSHKKIVFCSDYCKSQFKLAHPRIYPEVPCALCGKLFPQKGKVQTCSPECCKALRRKRMLAKPMRPLKVKKDPGDKRSRLAQLAWKTRVHQKDGRKCQVCGRTGSLKAHHVKDYRHHPEDRLVIENGITMCGRHHDAKSPVGFHHLFGYKSSPGLVAVHAYLFANDGV